MSVNEENEFCPQLAQSLITESSHNWQHGGKEAARMSGQPLLSPPFSSLFRLFSQYGDPHHVAS